MPVRLALKEILAVSSLQRALSLPTEKRKEAEKEGRGRSAGWKKKNRGNIIDLLFQGLSLRTILIAIGK